MRTTEPPPPDSDDSQALLEACLQVHRDDLVPFIEAFMSAMAAATGEARTTGADGLPNN